MKDKEPTIEEMLEELDKWWEQRKNHIAPGYWGRDLRDQTTMLNAISGIEEDITFILRYIKTLSEKLKSPVNGYELNKIILDEAKELKK